ncbi:hypothetical protein EJB05_26921, partial [Eragrostis curvula]
MVTPASSFLSSSSLRIARRMCLGRMRVFLLSFAAFPASSIIWQITIARNTTRESINQMMELTGNAARDNKKTRIRPRHIVLDIRKDEELGRLLAGVTIAHAGVVPNIHTELLPKKAVEKASGEEVEDPKKA